MSIFRKLCIWANITAFQKGKGCNLAIGKIRKHNSQNATDCRGVLITFGSDCMVANSFFKLIGCYFERLPHGSTSRYTEWHNSLTPRQRHLQVIFHFISGQDVVLCRSIGTAVLLPICFELLNLYGPLLSSLTCREHGSRD